MVSPHCFTCGVLGLVLTFESFVSPVFSSETFGQSFRFSSLCVP